MPSNMKNLTTITTLVIFLLPTFVLAANTYEPLVGIPGVDPNADFSGYINALYVLSISIAALLAVIKIIIAGVKWMMTDIVTTKGEAKKDIQGALIGLLIVLAAVLILTVINPKLVDVNLQLQPIQTTALPPGGPGVPNPGNGDVVEPTGSAVAAEKKAVCENIDMDKCNQTITGALFGAAANCYKGEYVEKGQLCIVRGPNHVKGGDEIDCKNLSDALCTQDGSCQYDCTEAASKCTAAGLKVDPKYLQNNTTFNEVECEWP